MTLPNLMGALLFVAAGSALAGSAYQPKFDPSRLKGPKTGAANQVFVLGDATPVQLARKLYAKGARWLADPT